MPAFPTLQPAGVCDSLTGFVDRWTQPLFDASERETISRVFSLLISRVFDDNHEAGTQRSQLCSDGTPVEFSLSFDSFSRFAIRYVCDTTNAAIPESALTSALRRTADIVVPTEWQSSKLLDRFFEQHLTGAPAQMRFRVWHGSGFAPGGHRVAKLYFNSEWLDSGQVHAILSEFVSEKELRTFEALRYPHYAGVGYDLDDTGISKVKVYVRLPEFRQAEMVDQTSQFLGDRSLLFERLVDCITSKHQPTAGDNSVFSFGLLPRSAAREAKAYFQLEKWGMPTFASVSPLLQSILTCWDIPQGAGFMSSGPTGFAPTLVSVGIDHDREIASVYFKPLLPADYL